MYIENRVPFMNLNAKFLSIGITGITVNVELKFQDTESFYLFIRKKFLKKIRIVVTPINRWRATMTRF